MCWIDLDSARCSEARFAALGSEAGLGVSDGRLVMNYQIAQNGDDVLRRLEQVFKRVFADPGAPSLAMARRAYIDQLD